MLSRKKNPEHILDKGKGFLSCLPLKLIQMQKSALIRALVTGKEIVGRGRDHYPIARDDQEYLDAIAVFNQSSEKRTKTGRAAHLKLSSDSFKYKLPSEIPFISDAHNVVYVLARRSAYLKWMRRKSVFRWTSFLLNCTRKQNMDAELSRIVAF